MRSGSDSPDSNGIPLGFVDSNNRSSRRPSNNFRLAPLEAFVQLRARSSVVGAQEYHASSSNIQIQAHPIQPYVYTGNSIPVRPDGTILPTDYVSPPPPVIFQTRRPETFQRQAQTHGQAQAQTHTRWSVEGGQEGQGGFGTSRRQGGGVHGYNQVQVQLQGQGYGQVLGIVNGNGKGYAYSSDLPVDLEHPLGGSSSLGHHQQYLPASHPHIHHHQHPAQPHPHRTDQSHSQSQRQTYSRTPPSPHRRPSTTSSTYTNRTFRNGRQLGGSSAPPGRKVTDRHPDRQSESGPSGGHGSKHTHFLETEPGSGLGLSPKRKNELRGDIGLSTHHGEDLVQEGRGEEGEEDVWIEKQPRPVKIRHPPSFFREEPLPVMAPSTGTGNRSNGKSIRGRSRASGGGGTSVASPYAPGRDGLSQKKKQAEGSSSTNGATSKFFGPDKIKNAVASGSGSGSGSASSQVQTPPSTWSGRAIRPPQMFTHGNFDKHGGSLEVRNASSSLSRPRDGTKPTQALLVQDDDDETEDQELPEGNTGETSSGTTREDDEEDDIEESEHEVELVNPPKRVQDRIREQAKRKKGGGPGPEDAQTNLDSWRQNSKADTGTTAGQIPNSLADDRQVNSLGYKGSDGKGVKRVGKAGDPGGGRGQAQAGSGHGSGNRAKLRPTRAGPPSEHVDGNGLDTESDGAPRRSSRHQAGGHDSLGHISVGSSGQSSIPKASEDLVTPSSDIEERENGRPCVKKESKVDRAETRNGSQGEGSSRGHSVPADNRDPTQSAKLGLDKENEQETPDGHQPRGRNSTRRSIPIPDSSEGEGDDAALKEAAPARRGSSSVRGQSAGPSRAASTPAGVSSSSKTPRSAHHAKHALAAENRMWPSAGSSEEEEEVPEEPKAQVTPEPRGGASTSKQRQGASKPSTSASQPRPRPSQQRKAKDGGQSRHPLAEPSDPIEQFADVVTVESDESSAETKDIRNKRQAAIARKPRLRSSAGGQDADAGSPRSDSPLPRVKKRKRSDSAADGGDVDVTGAPEADINRHKAISDPTKVKKSKAMLMKDGKPAEHPKQKPDTKQPSVKDMAKLYLRVVSFKIDGIEVLPDKNDWMLNRAVRDYLSFKNRNGSAFGIQLRRDDVCFHSNIDQMVHFGFTRRIPNDMVQYMIPGLVGDHREDHVYQIACDCTDLVVRNGIQSDLKKQTQLKMMPEGTTSTMLRKMDEILNRDPNLNPDARLRQPVKRNLRPRSDPQQKTNHDSDPLAGSPPPTQTASTGSVAGPQTPKPPKPLDPDELICQWPMTGRVEVNITAADMYRLEDYEYLNDTVIEFGLRYIARNEDQASVASDKVHVFNSFFYKKISDRFRGSKAGDAQTPAQAGTWEAYDSVKKWTSRVDIFEKEFIVVPINENLHWYSAIIYNPGAILSRARANRAAEKAKSLASTVIDAAVNETADKVGAQDDIQTSPRVADADIAIDTDPEADELGNNYAKGDDETQSDDLMTGGDNHDTGIEEADDSHDPIALPPTQPVPIRAPPMDRASLVEQQNSSTTQTQRPRPSQRFPGGSGGPRPSKDTPPVEAATKIPIVVPPDSCVIMTLDSMGNPHTLVAACLNRWLAYEAQKHLDSDGLPLQIPFDATAPAYLKRPLPPNQLNFTDCGVYLLHYVRRLLDRERKLIEKYLEIWARGVKTTPAEMVALREIWDDQGAKNGRSYWQKIIRGLQASQGKKLPIALISATQETTDSLELVGNPPADSASNGDVAGTVDPVDAPELLVAVDTVGLADVEAAEECLPEEPRSANSMSGLEGSAPPPLTTARKGQDEERLDVLYGEINGLVQDDPTTLQSDPGQDVPRSAAHVQVDAPSALAKARNPGAAPVMSFDIPSGSISLGNGAPHLFLKSDNSNVPAGLPSVETDASPNGGCGYVNVQPSFPIPSMNGRHDLDQASEDEAFADDGSGSPAPINYGVSAEEDVDMNDGTHDGDSRKGVGWPASVLRSQNETTEGPGMSISPLEDVEMMDTHNVEPDDAKHSEQDDVDMDRILCGSPPYETARLDTLAILAAGHSGQRASGSSAPARNNRKQRVQIAVRERDQTAPSSPAGAPSERVQVTADEPMTVDTGSGPGMGNVVAPPLIHASEQPEYGLDLMMAQGGYESHPNRESPSRSQAGFKRNFGGSGMALSNLINEEPREVIDVDEADAGRLQQRLITPEIV